MARSLKPNEILVVGGTGSIGSVIVEKLLQQGHNVAVIARGHRCHQFKNNDNLRLLLGVDVTEFADIYDCRTHHFDRAYPLCGIVYAVGDCPPGGFDEAISKSLSGLYLQAFLQEFKLHVFGLQNVVHAFRFNLRENGHIVVISSAITRLTDEQCPPFLQAGHYAAATAAKNELVKWLRRDSELMKSKILVHRLAPAACDTPFYRSCVHRPPAPALLSVETVALRVSAALQSSVPLDEDILFHPT